jgi:hypothetical protein
MQRFDFDTVPFFELKADAVNARKSHLMMWVSLTISSIEKTICLRPMQLNFSALESNRKDKKWSELIHHLTLVCPVQPVYALHHNGAPRAAVFDAGSLSLRIRQHYQSQFLELFERLKWDDENGLGMDITFENLRGRETQVWRCGRRIRAYAFDAE